MAVQIGSLLIKLGLDSGEFKSGLSVSERELKASTKRIRAMGKELQGLGTKLSVAVTVPMIALAKKSVEGFIDQQKAMAQVNATLASMGNGADRTAAQLSRMADAFELRSLFDAEDILTKVTAPLLTFGKLQGEVFDRAQQATLDLAQTFGNDLKPTAIAVGKALQDPIKGLTALSRVGVTFEPEQQKLIRSMVQVGDVAGAQRVILKALEGQVKKSAAAAADASPWRKAQVAIGQAMDVIGGAILPIIKPAAEAIASLASAFASLPEPVQKTIVVAGLLSATLGPLLIGFGAVVTSMAPFLGSLSLIAAQQGIFVALRAGVVGLATTFGPLAIAIGAAYLVWKNWDDIAPRLKPLVEELTAIAEGLGLVEVQAGRTSADLAKHEGFREFGAGLRSISDYLQKAADDFDAFNARNAAWNRKFRADIAQMVSDATASMKALYTGIKTWLLDKMESIWAGVAAKIEATKKRFHGLYDAVVGHSYVPDMVDGIAAEMGRLDLVMVDKAKKTTQKTAEAFREMAQDVRQLLDRLFPDAAERRADQDDRNLVERARKAGVIDQDTADRALTAINATRFSHDVPLSEGVLRALSESLVTGEAIRDQIELTARAIGLASDQAAAATVKIAKSFKDMAQDTIAALSNMVNAIKGGGFLDILSSVLNLVLQLGSIGLFGKSIQTNINKPIPAYAGGTSFHAGGLALVGERGPELVDLGRGSRVYTNSDSNRMLSGRTVVEIVDTTGLFVTRVNGQIMRAAPAIAEAGARGGASRVAYRNSRRVG